MARSKPPSLLPPHPAVSRRFRASSPRTPVIEPARLVVGRRGRERLLERLQRGTARGTGATILPPPPEMPVEQEVQAWGQMLARSEAAATEAKARVDAAKRAKAAARMAVARAAKAAKAAERAAAAAAAPPTSPARGPRLLAIPGKRGICCRGDIVQCSVRNGYGRGLEGLAEILSVRTVNRGPRTSVSLVSTPDTNMFSILRAAAKPVGGSVRAVRERARSTYYTKHAGREFWTFNY